MIFCPGGNVMDSNGCPTCRCSKYHIVRLIAVKHFIFFYYYDVMTMSMHWNYMQIQDWVRFMVSENKIDFDRVRNRTLVTPHNSKFMTGQYHNLPHLSSAPSKTPVKTTLLTLTTKVFFSKFLICPFQDQKRQPKVHAGLKPLSMLSANHWTALILRAQQTVSHLKINL